MAYDGVVTSTIVQELKDNLLLGKIEKIYQPQPEQLLFSIHTKSGKKKLFASASGSHSGLYLIDRNTENPETPPLFCMVLRKHLSASRITDIRQHEKDRIIEFLLETVDELGFNVNRKLIFEIMGKHSNIHLIDMQSGKIIDSIKHVGIDVNRARQILPGKLYEYPPSQDKVPFDQADEVLISQLITSQLQPSRSLMNGIQGISPVLAESLIEASTDEFDGLPSAHQLYNELTFVTESIDNGTYQPVVYINEDDKPVDFHMTPLKVYENDSRHSSLNFRLLSEAADYYFSHRESSNTIKQKSNDLKRVITGHTDKLKLKMQRLSEDLYKAENSDKYRLYGELLTANMHLVKTGMKEVKVISYYDGSEVTIPLDPRFQPSRNAQNYYKKYGKSKTAIKEKKQQLEETQADIEYLESVLAFVERAATIEEVDLLRKELTESGYLRLRKQAKPGRKKKENPKPYTYTLSSGVKVLAGRNNKENDWLTFKKAAPTDLWLHTKDIPGSHVIMILNGQQPTDEEIKEAAAIAAYHSKGYSSENVPVDYVRVRYVKKPSGSKPGFVIFTHNRTLYVNPAVPEQTL